MELKLKGKTFPFAEKKEKIGKVGKKVWSETMPKDW